MPTLNPDGFETKSFFVDSIRHNSKGRDLNRAFPTWQDLGKTRDELTRDREPEVVAAINWILDYPWVISINFHDGAVVANYPWDDDDTKPWEKSSLFRGGSATGNPNYTPDLDEFVSLAKLYSLKHPEMHKGTSSCGGYGSSKFEVIQSKKSLKKNDLLSLRYIIPVPLCYFNLTKNVHNKR